MLLLSRVCAEFRDRTGAVVWRVTPATRLAFQEVPESVKEDPLFNLLLADGSVEAVTSAGDRKKLEADPLKDTDATGRRIPASEPSGREGKAGGKAAKPASDDENHLTKEKKTAIMEGAK